MCQVWQVAAAGLRDAHRTSSLLRVFQPTRHDRQESAAAVGASSLQLASRLPTGGRVALAALLVAFCVELSQLYHAPWIDQLRATRLGGLLLGFSFVGSDLLCYGVGVGIGLLIDAGLTKRKRPVI